MYILSITYCIRYINNIYIRDKDIYLIWIQSVLGVTDMFVSKMILVLVFIAKRSVCRVCVLGAKKIPDWVKHKTQSTQLNSIFWCFLLIWLNLTCFGVKNIKIFVFCARIKLKGVDTTEIGCRILIIPTRKHALLLVW